MPRTKATTQQPTPQKRQRKSANANASANLPVPYPASDDIQAIIHRGQAGGNGYDLHELGQLRACAIGFLSALLQRLTHKSALEATGLQWLDIAHWQAHCPGYAQLYAAVRDEVDARKLQVIEDEAFEWAASMKRKGIYHEGKKVDEEAVHSDRLHEVLLRGMRPDRYGRLADQSSQQAVIINIDI